MTLEDLKEQAEIEFDDLHLLEKEILELLRVTADREPTVVERTAAGAFLAQFYGGVEGLLKRFVKNLGGKMPSGEAWHLELVRLFIHGSNSGMPALLDQKLYSVLAEFRKCRHAVRNCYGHELVWDKLRPLMELFSGVLHDFEISVNHTIELLSRNISDS